jgi:hypothetical protein
VSDPFSFEGEVLGPTYPHQVLEDDDTWVHVKWPESERQTHSRDELIVMRSAASAPKVPEARGNWAGIGVGAFGFVMPIIVQIIHPINLPGVWILPGGVMWVASLLLVGISLDAPAYPSRLRR